MNTSDRIRSNCSALASSNALVALSQTAASCPARRNARDSEASVLASSSTISRCAFGGNAFPRSFGSDARCGFGLVRAVLQCIGISRQFDHECSSMTRFAMDVDRASMIAYDGLHYGQSQAGAILFACVVRSEYPIAFFHGQPRTSIRNFNANVVLVPASPQAEPAALRHGFHGVQHEIGNSPMQ